MNSDSVSLELHKVSKNLVTSFLILEVSDFNIKFQGDLENLVCSLFKYLPTPYANEFCFNFDWPSIES